MQKRKWVIFIFLRKKVDFKNGFLVMILDISSSYAKLLGETNFQPREFPRSESKAKGGEKKRREMVITMASYALQTPPRLAHAKPPGPKPCSNIFIGGALCDVRASNFRCLKQVCQCLHD